MRRNWMIGIGVSILVTAALLVVGIGAFNAGQRNGDAVRVLTTGEPAGPTLVVPVDTWRSGWHGGPGFLVFPLILIGLILLFAARRRSAWGWGGPCGPGPGRGRGWYADDDRELQDWHRRAHAPATDAANDAPPVTATEPDDGR